MGAHYVIISASKFIPLQLKLVVLLATLAASASQAQQYNTFHYQNHPFIKYMGHHPQFVPDHMVKPVAAPVHTPEPAKPPMPVHPAAEPMPMHEPMPMMDDMKKEEMMMMDDMDMAMDMMDKMPMKAPAHAAPVTHQLPHSSYTPYHPQPAPYHHQPFTVYHHVT